MQQIKSMNRAAKRRQKKLARKAAKNRRGHPRQPLGQGLGGAPASRFSELVQKGTQLHQAGRVHEAETIYRRVLDINPDHADANHLLGVLLLQAGNHAQAVDSISRAVAVAPDRPWYHSNLGAALQESGRLEEAVTSYRKALAIAPDDAAAHNNLGNVLEIMGRLEEAVASCHNALAIKPDYVAAHINLGNALRHLGRLEETIASYYKALATKPDCAEAHSNLGNALKDLGQLDEAVASYRQALAIKPDYADAHRNMSFTLLNDGRLKEGLDEYEWRWRTVKFASMARRFSRPLWDGIAELKGRTILLWGEQGPQDMTIWSSCLPHLSHRAGHCIVECPAKLVPLFARSFPDLEVRPENRGSDAERDDFDFHLPMGSLFRHFLPELTAASGVKAFLAPDPDRVAFWKRRLGDMGPGPFVGISWKSPLMTPQRCQNYTELADWAPAFANREAVFVNLQCKDYEDDLAMAKRDFGVTVHDFGDLNLYDDLDEVAALAGALDVAISVSTAVAAITAGVGTPTWVVAWRQSPWNNFLLAPRGPSVRFFERDTGESWDAAFISIAECLAARADRG